MSTTQIQGRSLILPPVTIYWCDHQTLAVGAALTYSSHYETFEREWEEIVEETNAQAKQRGITTVTEVVQGEIYRTIVEYAAAREADLIVMPTHRR
jgi:nucleotide-binding universal stress UspA family protein